jgi:hypothetical protein
MIPSYPVSTRSSASKHRALFCLALAACLGLARPASADLVINGGFETGDFTGWTQSGDPRFTGVGNAATLANLGGSVHSGNFAAFFGPGTLGFITQDLATTPGTTYALDFWLAHPFTDPGSGVEWLVRVDGNTLLDSHDTPNFDYREFTFTFTATSNSTPLQLGFGEPPNFFFLDDVSVNAVPEPGSCLLAGVGTAVLFGYSRLRRKRARA